MDLIIQYDENLKRFVEAEPKAFVDFFLPEWSDKIDFDFKPVLLQQELKKLMASKGRKGKSIGDTIMKLRLKSGKFGYILIHIEFHAQDNMSFPKDMFIRFYRTFDAHHRDKEITVFAIFVSDRIPPNCDNFSYKSGFTKLKYEYPVYKVKDADEEALLASDNPFAMAMLACKYIINSKKSKDIYEERLVLKEKLINFILEKNKDGRFSQRTIFNILSFVVNIMLLPKGEEQQFKDNIFNKYKSKKDMAYTQIDIDFFNGLFKALYGQSGQELYNKVKQEERKRKQAEQKRKQAEQKSKQEEQKRKQAEQKSKQEEQKRKQEEQKRKQEEQKRKQEEQKRKQEEQKRKQEEQKRKQEEQKRKQEEQKVVNLVLNLYLTEKMSIKQIASISGETQATIEKIIKERDKEK